MQHSEWNKNRDFLAEGIITLHLPVEPVSLQASRRKKELITSEIHNIISKFSFILLSDVQISIEWHIHPQKRYESDSSADVDNIIKPILDAISGSRGIIVDDCQVQAISCHWVDWDRDEQKITITIQMIDNDAWRLKYDLVFVHMGKGLCYPIALQGEAPEEVLSIVEALKDRIERRERRMAEGASYYFAQMSMPLRRIFHISRLKEFDVVQLADLKKNLLTKIKESGVPKSTEDTPE